MTRAKFPWVPIDLRERGTALPRHRYERMQLVRQHQMIETSTDKQAQC